MNAIESALEQIKSIIKRIQSTREEMGLNEYEDLMRYAFDKQFNPQDDSGMVKSSTSWIVDYFSDHVIAEQGGLDYSVAFTQGGAGAESPLFADRSQWIPVQKTWIPIPMQGRSTIVTRQADGKYRWIGVVATSVINHDGMIDSRQLFDSFIQHIQETKEYPKYDVLHFGQDMTIGQCDYVTRDGAAYIASGTFYDDEFSQAVARTLESNPEYWGHSIQFLSGDPYKLEIYGEDIPVFTDGINQFVSVVPRSRAASMFTDVAVAQQQRGIKMMTDTQFQELVKLVGPEMAAKKKTELDQLNRTIEEAGMIQRTKESKVEEAKPEAKPAEKPVVEISSEDSQPATEEVRAEAPAEPEYVKRIDDAFAEMRKQLGAIVTSMETAQKEVSERLAKVEQSDDKKIAEVLADMPEAKPSANVRAREARASGDVKVDPTETINRLHSQRDHRK